MKKLFLLVVAFVFAAGAANAQDIFNKGNLVGNLGIGLGNGIYGSGYSSKIPPLSVSMDYGLVDNLIQGNNGSIGLGGYLGYTSASLKYPGVDYYWKSTAIIIGARGTFHYQFIDRLDTYAGLLLGYNVASGKWHGDLGGATITTTSVGGFTFSLFLGARYYFTQQLGVFAELGYGIANFNLGVTYKF